MISNIDLMSHLDNEPMPDGFLPKDIQALHDKMVKALAHNYEKTKDLIWRQAMILANGGTMPDMDEIKRRATQIIDKEGTTYLLWDHPPIKPGDEVDLSFAIAELKKPKI